MYSRVFWFVFCHFFADDPSHAAVEALTAAMFGNDNLKSLFEEKRPASMSVSARRGVVLGLKSGPDAADGDADKPDTEAKESVASDSLTHLSPATYSDRHCVYWQMGSQRFLRADRLCEFLRSALVKLQDGIDEQVRQTLLQALEPIEVKNQAAKAARETSKLKKWYERQSAAILMESRLRILEVQFKTLAVR